jgi:hypothetical protein
MCNTNDFCSCLKDLCISFLSGTFCLSLGAQQVRSVGTCEQSQRTWWCAMCFSKNVWHTTNTPPRVCLPHASDSDTCAFKSMYTCPHMPWNISTHASDCLQVYLYTYLRSKTRNARTLEPYSPGNSSSSLTRSASCSSSVWARLFPAPEHPHDCCVTLPLPVCAPYAQIRMRARVERYRERVRLMKV